MHAQLLLSHHACALYTILFASLYAPVMSRKYAIFRPDETSVVFFSLVSCAVLKYLKVIAFFVSQYIIVERKSSIYAHFVQSVPTLHFFFVIFLTVSTFYFASVIPARPFVLRVHTPG